MSRVEIVSLLNQLYNICDPHLSSDEDGTLELINQLRQMKLKNKGSGGRRGYIINVNSSAIQASNTRTVIPIIKDSVTMYVTIRPHIDNTTQAKLAVSMMNDNCNFDGMSRDQIAEEFLMEIMTINGY